VRRLLLSRDAGAARAGAVSGSN